MAEIAVQDLKISAPVAPAYAAASAGGDFFKPRSSGGVVVLMHIKNGGAAAITVTIDDPTSVSPVGAAAWNPDMQVAVPAGAERIFPVTPPDRFTDAAGNVNVTYSAVTTVTVGVFRVI